VCRLSRLIEINGLRERTDRETNRKFVKGSARGDHWLCVEGAGDLYGPRSSPFGGGPDWLLSRALRLTGLIIKQGIPYLAWIPSCSGARFSLAFQRVAADSCDRMMASLVLAPWPSLQPCRLLQGCQGWLESWQES
jgi:hypothetical protein